jgi:ATPase subunit of ABC transporter with duplicated ATPase domains
MATERIDVLSVMGAAVALLACESYPETSKEVDEARTAVAELIEADHEYEAARRDWDHVTAHDPEETPDETWRQVADRYEAAVMRRAEALARVGGA